MIHAMAEQHAIVDVVTALLRSDEDEPYGLHPRDLEVVRQRLLALRGTPELRVAVRDLVTFAAWMTEMHGAVTLGAMLVRVCSELTAALQVQPAGVAVNAEAPVAVRGPGRTGS